MNNPRVAALSIGIVVTLAAAHPAAAACRALYFSSVRHNVGTAAGAQRMTQEEPSLAAFRLGPFSVGTKWVEVARFYTPVLSSSSNVVLNTIVDKKPIVTLYADKTGIAQLQARVVLQDFDPATGSTRVISEALTSAVTGNQTNAAHSVMSLPITAGTTIAEGHRLLWTISYVSHGQPNNVLFRFGGNTSPAFARICWKER